MLLAGSGLRAGTHGRGARSAVFGPAGVAARRAVEAEQSAAGGVDVETMSVDVPGGVGGDVLSAASIQCHQRPLALLLDVRPRIASPTRSEPPHHGRYR